MSHRPKRRLVWRIARALAGAVLVYLVFCAACLVVLRWVDPPFTTVQAQRRLESLFSSAAYSKQYRFVPLSRIRPDFQHAVIAAEDTRFYQHHGVDWLEIEKGIETELPEGRVRGYSTITQQMVKNLFMTTHANPLRKPAEWILAPVAELVLGKQRVLEIYINVIEWGPGVYGAEAAARHYYGIPANAVSRNQAARLAACIPSPLRYRPQQMNRLSGIVLDRMRILGW